MYAYNIVGLSDYHDSVDSLRVFMNNTVDYWMNSSFLGYLYVGYLSVGLHRQYSTNLCSFTLIYPCKVNYHDSIHNCEYYHFTISSYHYSHCHSAHSIVPHIGQTVGQLLPKFSIAERTLLD